MSTKAPVPAANGGSETSIDDSVNELRASVRSILDTLVDIVRKDLPIVEASCDQVADTIARQVSDVIGAAYLRASAAIEQQFGLPRGDTH